MHQEYPEVSAQVHARQSSVKSFRLAGFQDASIDFYHFLCSSSFLLFKSTLVLNDHSGYYMRWDMEE